MIVSLTVQFGGPDAMSTFQRLIVAMRKSLKLLGNESQYITSVTAIKLRCRIAGEIETYPEETGVYNLRLGKKSGVVFAEIIINAKSWKIAQSTPNLLKTMVKQSFEAIIEKANREGLMQGEPSLIKDLEQKVFLDFDDRLKNG